MRQIIRYLRTHLQEAFHPVYYAAVGILLAVSLAYNFGTSFQARMLAVREGWQVFAFYFLFYSIPYLTTLVLYTLLVRRSPQKLAWWRERRFWLLAGFGLIILALDGTQPFRGYFYEGYMGMLRIWRRQISFELYSLFTTILPLAIHYLWQREQSRMYGLGHLRVNLWPYFWMLVAMWPLIAAASFLPSFQRQYPMFRAEGVGDILGWPGWLPALLFELAYGLDFVSVELLFRGFFVIGMARVLGREAVLPMAVIYCHLHYGKPLGEAISSIFGGYILGVIAYQSRTIWGGILLHIGVAWSMELAAWLQG